MKNATFLASQSTKNTTAITIIVVTTMINVLNLANVIIACSGLSWGSKQSFAYFLMMTLSM